MRLAEHCRCDKALFYQAMCAHSPEATTTFLRVAEAALTSQIQSK
jgi:hypothetical protein